MSPKVQAFAKKFYAALDAGSWGDMEPEIFQNIAEGLVTPGPLGFHANKSDQDEMADAVEAMVAILEEVL